MAYRNVFSLPVSQKHQASMRRRFIAFSAILFLLIFILSSMAFIFLMGQILHRNTTQELINIVELERLRLEASVKGEIAIVLKLANSPLIKRYFVNPENILLEQYAFDEIEGYRKAFSSNLVFWINDIDKLLYTTNQEPYKVDPNNWDNYWYNMTLYETGVYNFNINYNPDLNVTNLWINAPVFDNNNVPIGIVGTGINLSSFINNIYMNYTESAELYLFNIAGEITGARNIDLVANKVSIQQKLEHIDDKILHNAKYLINNEVINYRTKKEDGVIVLGAIPALDWYITVIHHFAFGDELRTGMTALFIVIMLVILAIFAVINIFIAKLLQPLYHIVKEISQLSSNWDLKQDNKPDENDEIGTLGEFLNMTVIDQLTEIYNRRYFDGSMKMLIKTLSRNDSKLSLLMIDIDYFKNYNDTYGHDAGDKCLKEIAAALSKVIIREEDFVARYGGEEFVVVLPNTDENGARLIADKLLSKVRECGIPHESSDVEKYVTISIGGTTGTVKHFHEESVFVIKADSALYKSKQNGRNQYTFEAF